MIKLQIWAIRAENSTSSFEQLIVAAIKLMVFTKIKYFREISLLFCLIYFREKMRNIEKKFTKRFVRWIPLNVNQHKIIYLIFIVYLPDIST